jgi:hypothetical protein
MIERFPILKPENKDEIRAILKYASDEMQERFGLPFGVGFHRYVYESVVN